MRSRWAECSSRCSRSTTGPKQAAASARNASATVGSTEPSRPTTAAYGSPKRLHGDRAKVGAPEERKAGAAAQDGLRLCANAAARLAGATEGEDALEPTGGAPPERDLGEDVEPEQEVELRLGRQQGRELEKPWVACCLAEEDDSRGGEREGARLGDSSGGPADVGLVQLEGGCELDHGPEA